MNNEILMAIEIVLVFGSVVAVKHFFGKEGLIAWMPFASVMAQIQVCKAVELLGISSALGNIMFASNFLVTDILTECYGKEYAKKGAWLAFAAVFGFFGLMQITVLFTPSDIDTAQPAFETLFTLVPRICIASNVMCLAANMADIYLYDFLREKMKGRHMWIRNNIATILCNTLENYAFGILAFLGIYTLTDCFWLAVSGSLVEVIAALCDTPFLYLAKNKA